MNFNEIFNRVKPLWKSKYRLSYGNKRKSFIPSISAEYRRVSNLVDVEYRHNFTEWESMLVFTMFSNLTEKGLFYLEKKHNKYLNIDEISIEQFEKKYLENLKEEGNEDFLDQYEGMIK